MSASPDLVDITGMTLLTCDLDITKNPELEGNPPHSKYIFFNGTWESESTGNNSIEVCILILNHFLFEIHFKYSYFNINISILSRVFYALSN